MFQALAAGTNAGLGLVLGALTMGLGFGAMLMLTSMRGTREKVARSLNNVKHSLNSMRTCGAHTDTLKGATSHNKFMTGSRLVFVLLIGALAQGVTSSHNVWRQAKNIMIVCLLILLPGSNGCFTTCLLWRVFT